MEELEVLLCLTVDTSEDIREFQASFFSFHFYIIVVLSFYFLFALLFAFYMYLVGDKYFINLIFFISLSFLVFDLN